MFHLRNIFIICILLIFAGCYESETVVEINPDGSGIVTSIMHFDNATEEQRQQIKALLNQPDVKPVSKMEQAFPSPYFEIVEHVEDKETLRFKSVIRFTDINRLLAVDSKSHVWLKGIDFEVDGENLIFKITRSSQQSSLGSNWKITGKLEELGENVHPGERIKLVDSQSGNSIEFSHQYKGKGIKWQGILKIPGHTIKRNIIKYNFADYSKLKPTTGRIVEAAWYRNSTFSSYLDLEIGVPLPIAEEFVYIGYDQTYLLAGQYSDGNPLELAKEQKEFKRFNDNPLGYGYRKFELPLKLSFPESPVEGLSSLKIRLRVLCSKNLKRIELGPIKANHTYESAPFTFTTEDLEKDKLSLEVKGPIGQLKEFFVKTKRGNIFPLKVFYWPFLKDRGSIRFQEFLPLSDLALLVEFYEPAEYCWMDVNVPSFDLRRQFTDSKKLISNLFPEITSINYPPISDNIFKDKLSFERYWEDLDNEQILPALIDITLNLDHFLERFKDNWGRYMEVSDWYQTDLVKKLKERKEFFETNKEKIANVFFKLYLELSDQNNNNNIVYFLSNTGLTDLIRDKALEAVKKQKLRNEIDRFFKGELSEEERKVFYSAFEKSDYWVESIELLKLLTQGPDGDWGLVQRVLDDKGGNILVRGYALEIIIDHERDNFPASVLKSYILDPKMRGGILHRINFRLNSHYHSSEEISKEELKKILIPLIPVFEDLAEQKDKYKSENALKILEAIQ